MQLKRTALSVALCCMATTISAGHELEGRDLVLGQTLYAEHCAACHGADLEGQPDWRRPDEDGLLPAPPHDETGHTWHHDNRLLFDYIALGGAEAMAARGVTGLTSGMPAFGGTLTELQIWDVLAFIRSTWPQRVQDIQSARNPPHD